MNFYINLVILLLSLVGVVSVFWASARHNKRRDETRRRFLESEDAANSVRKKEIDPALFYTADLSVLPPIPEGDPHQVARCAKRVMIYFAEPLTNLELKMQYGPAQMDFIAEYEENFNAYLKALTKWAAEATDADAIKILQHAISLGSEYRDTYRLAADILSKQGDKYGMESLLAHAEKNHFRDPSIRQQVLEYIRKKDDKST
ncbi:MAG: hypothetical protein FWF78_07430 [Defluviitaleaceae bacterium]|nr:hypothetical protein [Defluviitaleaceae bacterium]